MPITLKFALKFKTCLFTNILRTYTTLLFENVPTEVIEQKKKNYE